MRRMRDGGTINGTSKKIALLGIDDVVYRLSSISTTGVCGCRVNNEF